MDESTERWSERTFGGVDLGDGRLTKRLVGMGAVAAATPAGTVTRSMQSSAQREGAFRFVENERVVPEAINEGMCFATALECAELPAVYVAVDQTDLTFVDRKNIRGLGPDCSKTSSCLRGVQVMNALAIDEAGVPIGLLAQEWWLRAEEHSPEFRVDKRPADQRESSLWPMAVEASVVRLQQAAPDCRPWFLCDRGADIGSFLQRCVELDIEFTVRACHDRSVRDDRGRCRKLFSTLARQPIVATFKLRVPRGNNRSARIATCEIRIATRITIVHQGTPIAVSVVRVRETGFVPDTQNRIDWKLLTTFPVTNATDALWVIRGYTFRWRVEEFHKTWKSGGCNVERSQLRSYAGLRRWATILAAVATRVERLKRLSREQPNLDALTEFSRQELDVAIAMTQTKKFKPGDNLTLDQAVRLIAVVGGYMNRNSDGPPGSSTIKLGLERVVPAARALKLLHSRSG